MLVFWFPRSSAGTRKTSVFCGSGFQPRFGVFDADRGKMPLPQADRFCEKTAN